MDFYLTILFSLLFWINRSPHEALFGSKVKVGLTTSSLPKEVLGNVDTEEELQELTDGITNGGVVQEPSFPESSEPLGSRNDILPHCCVCYKKDMDSKCRKCDRDLHSQCGKEIEEATSIDRILLCDLCLKIKKTLEGRTDARDNLEAQAKRMRLDSDKKFPPVPVGATVRVPVPEVDRGRGDHRNILAVVKEVTEDGFYKLGTSNGILKSLYSRAQFTVCPKQLINERDTPNCEIPLRTAAASESLGGGQGFKKCYCKNKCITKRCICVRSNLKCSSKCHGTSPCCNK